MKPYEKPEVQKKLAIIKDVILSIAPDTESIYLFGSYASGKPHEYSDLDIFVVVPESYTNEFELQLQFSYAIRMAIDKYMALDVLVNTSNSFKNNLQYISSIDSIVVDTGIKIYG